MESDEDTWTGLSAEGSHDVLKEIAARALLIVRKRLDDVDGVEAEDVIEHGGLA
jgi:hypothetical protein